MTPIASTLSPTVQRLQSFGIKGVQLFHIASAVTLFLSWRERSGRDAQPVVAFFIRRFFRIAPLFYLAIGLPSSDGTGARQ